MSKSRSPYLLLTLLAKASVLEPSDTYFSCHSMGPVRVFYDSHLQRDWDMDPRVLRKP